MVGLSSSAGAAVKAGWICALAALLLLSLAACGEDEGPLVATGDDCAKTLPAKTPFGGSGVPTQVTMIYDPLAHNVSLSSGYTSGETLVVDNNLDGTYMLTIGMRWEVASVSPGEIVRRVSFAEWRGAPPKTPLALTLRTRADRLVTITLAYDSAGLQVLSVCR